MDDYALLAEEERLRGDATQATRGGGTYTALAADEAAGRQNALNASLRLAVPADPVRAAKTRTLAGAAGLPDEVVDRNADTVTTQVRVRELRRLMADSPILARQMTDPAFARIAHDSAESLSLLERAAAMPRAAVAGLVADVPSGAYGLMESFAKLLAPIGDPLAGTILPENPLRRIAAGLEQWRKATARTGEAIAGDQSKLGFVERGIASGFRSFGQMTPGLVASIASGNPQFALGAGAALAGSQAATKGHDAGLGPVQALLYGTQDAAVEYLTERLPVGALLKDIKAGAPFWKILLHQAATEIPTEIAATTLQNLNEFVHLHPERTFGQYLDALPEDIAQTVIATVTTTLLTAGMGRAVSRPLRRDQQAADAQQGAAMLDQMLKIAAGDKLRERSPADFATFAQQVAYEKGLQSVFVDAATFAQSAREAGIDVAAAMPETAKQLPEALATKGDLVIPLGELMAAIPGTGMENTLLQHVRLGADASTLAETQNPQFAADTQAEVADVLAQHEFRTAHAESAAAVENELFAQLETAGRFTKDVNAKYAALAAAFYATQAHQLGLTPQAMHALYPLQINARSAPGKNLLQQIRQVFGQPAENDRANISFADDITKAPSIITLGNKADLSSFLHEMGHFQLEVLTHIASQPNAPAGIAADTNAVLKWFGVPDLATWRGMSLEQKRAHHEQFARGFEAYLFEGKAPSVELQGVFARFRAWLVNVYRQIKNLNVELSDEVRGVFARLVATNEQILEAEAQGAYVPLFKSAEQAGMTPAEWAAYQALGTEATQEAVDTLQTRSLRNMAFAANARSRAIKALQKEAEGKRAAVEAEVAAEVRQEPVYAAQRFLRYGELPTGEKVVGAKLDLAALKEMYGDAPAAPWRYLSTGQQGLAGNEGLHPDQVAEMFGFSSGDALVRSILAAHPEAAMIEGLTDQRMLERYGDLASPEAIERAANDAVHNEVRAKFIATELRALTKATGNKNILAAAAKQFAAAIIGRKRVDQIRPRQYAAAEARAARAAERAKTVPEKARHKRDQLVNFYATRAAYDAQAEVDKGLAFLRRVVAGNADDVAKTRDVDVVMAARAILADYGIGTKGKAAHEYLAAVQRYDPAMHEVLRDRVDALAQNAKPIDKLTVDEFRALRDEIGAMWHLARRSRQMEVDGDLMDRQDVQDALRERMDAIGVPDTVPGEGKAVTDGERRLAGLRTMRAALRRVESWVGVKDGAAQMGPFRRYIWQQVKDAADRYRADKAARLRQYRELLAPIAPTLAPARIDAPELGYTFGFSRGGSGTAEILHAILHTGNASNKKKLLLGRRWATEREDGSIDTSRWDAFLGRMIQEGKITKAHFDFVQGVWNLFEEIKPLAQKTHRDVFGHYFAEVTAEPVSTPFGVYAGGYVPALTDPEVVTDAKTRALIEEENEGLAHAFPATNRGFTKSRVEYNQPLLLDLRVISQHLDKVLLFSHLEQPVRDVRRVLTAKGVAYALNRIDPAAFDGLLTPWLNRTARQQVETPIAGSGGLMRFFSAARSRAGMAAMFANVSNTVQQITGMSTAAVLVRPKYLLGAVGDFVRSPSEFVRTVSEASVYMNSRMENEVGQLTDAINGILLNPSVIERAQAWTAKHAYFLQAAVDNVLSPIVWTGAYNQALEQGARELDAKRLADGVVRQTQGSTLPEEVSRIETGNAFARMFTQFAGYFNTQANMLGTEFARNAESLGLRKGAGRAFYILLFGFLAPAWVAEFITQAFRGGPDDEDRDGEYIDDWIAAVFGFGTLRYGTAMVPVVGQVINAAVNTANSKPYDDRISTAPAISMIENAVQAPHSVYKAIVDEGRPGRAVKDVAALVSLALGVPASALARPVSFAVDVAAERARPTSPADAVRGAITGAASPASRN